MPAFAAFKALAGAAAGPSGPQEMEVTAQANYVLLNDSTFTDFNKNLPITVTVVGDITSTSTSTDAFTVGDLSTWDEVNIVFQSGTDVYGKGGNGGNGEADGGSGPNAGGTGGDALFIHASNSDTILSVTVDSGASLRGGGGGGGGGNRRGFSDYNPGPKTCQSSGTNYAPGGGGGGGAGQNVGTGGTGPGNATNGSSGTATGGGANGLRGSVAYQDSSCNNQTGFGYHGRDGGASGTNGQSASNSAGPGTRGYYIRNSGSCNFTNNGTVAGLSS